MLQLGDFNAKQGDDGESTKRMLFTYPMIKQTDMSEDMRGEVKQEHLKKKSFCKNYVGNVVRYSQVLEVCVNACEKHTSNNESAAKLIKESLDKRFGTSWHVVVGEGFGFEVSYELKNLMYMYFAGNLAVCAWKCS